jgi:hypothetical protein
MASRLPFSAQQPWTNEEKQVILDRLAVLQVERDDLAEKWHKAIVDGRVLQAENERLRQVLYEIGRGDIHDTRWAARAVLRELGAGG